MTTPIETAPSIDLAGLPASDRILRGLGDLAAGVPSADAALVAIAANRLRELGLAVPAASRLPAEPEHALYERMASAADPFYAYVAAKRELDSFLAALERPASRSAPKPAG